ELSPHSQPIHVLAPDGSTVLVFANGNPVPPSFSPPVTTLNGMAIYFNPQDSRAFRFSRPVRAFGISVVWGSLYNPNGISIVAYDFYGYVIGAAIAQTNNSITGPFTTSGGPNYEGFLGFTSSVPVYSVSFGGLEGSVWYDNA